MNIKKLLILGLFTVLNNYSVENTSTEKKNYEVKSRGRINSNELNPFEDPFEAPPFELDENIDDTYISKYIPLSKGGIDSYYRLYKGGNIQENFYLLQDKLKTLINDNLLYNELFYDPYELKKNNISLKEDMFQCPNMNYYNGLIKGAITIINELKKKNLEKSSILEIIKNFYKNITILNKINFEELSKNPNIVFDYEGKKIKLYIFNYKYISIDLVNNIKKIISYMNNIEDFNSTDYVISLNKIINFIFEYKDKNNLSKFINNPLNASNNFLKEISNSFLKKESINNIIQEESLLNIELNNENILNIIKSHEEFLLDSCDVESMKFFNQIIENGINYKHPLLDILNTPKNSDLFQEKLKFYSNNNYKKENKNKKYIN